MFRLASFKEKGPRTCSDCSPGISKVIFMRFIWTKRLKSYMACLWKSNILMNTLHGHDLVLKKKCSHLWRHLVLIWVLLKARLIFTWFIDSGLSSYMPLTFATLKQSNMSLQIVHCVLYTLFCCANFCMISSGNNERTAVILVVVLGLSWTCSIMHWTVRKRITRLCLCFVYCMPCLTVKVWSVSSAITVSSKACK